MFCFSCLLLSDSDLPEEVSCNVHKMKKEKENGEETMAKKKLCRNYETLSLYITFLEASSPLGGNNPPRGEDFSKHLLDIRTIWCRLNRVLETELFHLCHAQRTCSMSLNLPAKDRRNKCLLWLEKQN